MVGSAIRINGLLSKLEAGFEPSKVYLVFLLDLGENSYETDTSGKLHGLLCWLNETNISCSAVYKARRRIIE